MKRLDTIQVGEGNIRVKVIDMKNVHVIAPFFLACSHYYNRENTKYGCDKNILHGDDRVCCDCNFYDGGSVLVLDWRDGKEINFMRYPFKTQYSLEQIKSLNKLININK